MQNPAILLYVANGVAVLLACIQAVLVCVVHIGPGATSTLGSAIVRLNERLPDYTTLHVCRGIAMLFLAVVLVVGTIGIAKLQRWGRGTCIAYGLLTLLIRAGYLAYAFFVVYPAVVEMTPLRAPGVRTVWFDIFEHDLVLILFEGILIAHAALLLRFLLSPEVEALFPTETTGGCEPPPAARERPETEDVRRASA
jgi:hypothetical protein